MANKYNSLEGGLDLETPPIEASPGSCLEALNFYENVKGGYTTALGYERFDGRDAPSTFSYYYILIGDASLAAGAVNDAIGQVITVAGLTGQVVAREENAPTDERLLIIADFTGTPAALPVAYDTGASVTSVSAQGRGETAWETGSFGEWMTAAQQVQRDRVTTVPGAGDILGVAQNGDNVFAWRDDGGGLLDMFKASATGWQAVPLAEVFEVDITAATEASIGDVCNGGQDVIVGVEPWLDAALSPDANKRVYIVKRVSGATPTAFTNDVGAVNHGSVITSVTWSPASGGKVRYINHNFFAGLLTYNLYFADGVNCAMVWEAQHEVVRPISANYRTISEVVSHVYAHNSRLFMATTGGTFLTSVAGEPTTIDGTLDSQEVGLGDDITGFAATGSENLAIFTRNRTFGFTGSGPSTWKLTPLSTNSGARDGCIAQTDDVFSSDDRGIAKLARTEKLGGFDAATVTDDVQSLFSQLHDRATCATTIRTLNQMRFFYGNRFLFLSRVPYNANGNEGIRYGITEGLYDVDVLCVSTEENTAGDERTFFGSDDGYVYQADSGTSADGADMEFILSLHYNHMGTPLINKRYVGVDFEATVTAPTTFQIYYYMNDGRKTFDPRTIGFTGGESLWDVAVFDSAVFDAIPLTRPRMKLRGTGYNLQFSFYRQSSHEPQATLTGYAIRVKPRREVSI